MHLVRSLVNKTHLSSRKRHSGVSVRNLALLLMTLLLAGCVTLIAPLSEKPADSNHGKRTLGAKIEDQSIRNKVRINLHRRDEQLRDARIRVHSHNGHVLITGQVANERLKQNATRIASEVRHVRDVHNELTLAGAVSWLARTNDRWLTSKAKTRLLLNQSTPGMRTRVVTESGVVYLMGLLSREEADRVVEQIQRVYGVQKIIKIIEYLD